MGQIKSALELALERTQDIEADKAGLETRQIKEGGMRMYSWLEAGELEKAQKFLKDSADKNGVLSGLYEILMSRITLPTSEQQLGGTSAMASAIEFIFPKNPALREVPAQIKQFFESYLADRTSLVETLRERFEPMLREKEQQLAQQTGQRVRLTPETDPDFAKALQANLENLNEQYNQVLDRVRNEISTSYQETRR